MSLACREDARLGSSALPLGEARKVLWKEKIPAHQHGEPDPPLALKWNGHILAHL